MQREAAKQDDTDDTGDNSRVERPQGKQAKGIWHALGVLCWVFPRPSYLRFPSLDVSVSVRPWVYTAWPLHKTEVWEGDRRNERVWVVSIRTWRGKKSRVCSKETCHFFAAG